MRKHIFLAIFILFSFLLTFSSITNARIVRTTDEAGSAILCSTTKLKNQPWENIGLWTELSYGAPYILELTTSGYKDWVFFDGQVSIHIKDVWYELPTVQQKTSNNWPTVTTVGLYTVPQPVLKELASLNNIGTVELRLAFRDKTYVQWNVPDNILTEWQELILRTK